MKATECCGKTMDVTLETPYFMELYCNVCDYYVYIRKNSMEMPQSIND